MCQKKKPTYFKILHFIESAPIQTFVLEHQHSLHYAKLLGFQPGETKRLPLEVALMKMVSTPSPCDNVLELIEWIETSDSYVLILERPSPCTDLRQFLECHDGRLSEPLAQKIMRQVVRVARHCWDCGVLHRDIKADNLLINTDTLEVKLIDFGCGDLLKDTAYEEYEEEGIRFAEDPIQEDWRARQTLWPKIDQARKEGMAAVFRGPFGFFEGKRIVEGTADMGG